MAKSITDRLIEVGELFKTIEGEFGIDRARQMFAVVSGAELTTSRRSIHVMRQLVYFKGEIGRGRSRQQVADHLLDSRQRQLRTWLGLNGIALDSMRKRIDRALADCPDIFSK